MKARRYFDGPLIGFTALMVAAAIITSHGTFVFYTYILPGYYPYAATALLTVGIPFLELAATLTTKLRWRLFFILGLLVLVSMEAMAQYFQAQAVFVPAISKAFPSASGVDVATFAKEPAGRILPIGYVTILSGLVVYFGFAASMRVRQLSQQPAPETANEDKAQAEERQSDWFPPTQDNSSDVLWPDHDSSGEGPFGFDALDYPFGPEEEPEQPHRYNPQAPLPVDRERFDAVFNATPTVLRIDADGGKLQYDGNNVSYAGANVGQHNELPQMLAEMVLNNPGNNGNGHHAQEQGAVERAERHIVNPRNRKPINVTPEQVKAWVDANGGPRLSTFDNAAAHFGEGSGRTMRRRYEQAQQAEGAKA
jgi:hypothetical protein